MKTKITPEVIAALIVESSGYDERGMHELVDFVNYDFERMVTALENKIEKKFAVVTCMCNCSDEISATAPGPLRAVLERGNAWNYISEEHLADVIIWLEDNERAIRGSVTISKHENGELVTHTVGRGES